MALRVDHPGKNIHIGREKEYLSDKVALEYFYHVETYTINSKSSSAYTAFNLYIQNPIYIPAKATTAAGAAACSFGAAACSVGAAVFSVEAAACSGEAAACSVGGAAPSTGKEASGATEIDVSRLLS